jgi:hypothetical protein
MGKPGFIHSALAGAFFAILGIAAAAHAQLQDWEQPSRLDILNKGFAVLAHSCVADFGFTQLPAPSLNEARDKLQAYLDLSVDGDSQEENWLTLMHHRNSLLGSEGSTASRASRGLEAAVDDPSTYTKGERLYVDTVVEGQREVLADCQAVADDPYIGAHYLTGKGQLRDNEATIKQQFSRSVVELRAFKKKLYPKRK